jgi:monooxygenase
MVRQRRSFAPVNFILTCRVERSVSPERVQEHFDVVVVGAGLSGIGAGYHLQANCPKKSYVILEGRENIGGTWDLFRYPGIRSDSDMYTLGYAFKPWTHPKAIADGSTILDYIGETARENGIDKKIRFNTKVKRAAWSTEESRWTVETESGPDRQVKRVTCNFLLLCSGYYRYEEGHKVAFAGADRFRGRIVHPQKWTDDIDHAGKRVVVIGSGATAVTLVQERAKAAAHVTMLQRSPTYIVARPSEDALAIKLRRWLSPMGAYRAIRWRNVLRGMHIYRLSRKDPERIKKFIMDGTRAALPGVDVDTHFKPRYNPWDQRMCLAPDGDMFKAIRGGKASVVTDHIETFTETGIKLKSGQELPADLIVTATGLELQAMGNIQMTVDGKAIEPGKTLNYKGIMYSDIPNMASVNGYTNASWTLKCDLTCEYLCRMLNHMDKHAYAQCTPRLIDPTVTTEPLLGLASGYIQRAADRMPKQGNKKPWRLNQNYVKDILLLRHGTLEDGTLSFARARANVAPQKEKAAA